MAGPESVEYLKLVRADGTEVTARVERRDREGNAWVYTLAPRDDSGRSWQVKVFPHENGVNDALAELTCALAHLRHKASGQGSAFNQAARTRGESKRSSLHAATALAAGPLLRPGAS
ncbi:hypothetical protein FNF29_06628 [Cafeteria roenbergensis]|uniref:Uncharacterized protein n=1 Tax=Cafeteria roenbergensis TaxID=33653 RepID=A0A5A8C955_CAFRO|nr:hypothetical protein FNF29_06628 [Cafeteria roenbergensis]|eukprot:KAA0148570.1 hypothetical protein FNF29_06628 [Cafeteria roenbergensis]